MNGKLILKDGSVFEGQSFGYEQPRSGELVFSTGMVGYPESLTDPSYEGQILVATYPIIGSYGVPDKKFWESDRIHVSGLIVSQYIDTPSHFQSQMTLGQWLKKEKVPGLVITDTRYLTKKLRDEGINRAGNIFISNSRYCKFENSLQAIDAGIRIGFAYYTLGVVSSPIEGFTEIKIGKTRDAFSPSIKLREIMG